MEIKILKLGVLRTNCYIVIKNGNSLIIDPKTGKWWLLRMIYLDYVDFEEKINYSHDYSEKTF